MVTLPRRSLVVAVVLAALFGFCAGWMVRTRDAQTVEDRAHEAVEHLRKSLEGLTR
jgi:hypothetical protein